MAIPSQALRPNGRREGVETRRAAPNARTRNGEGIVQTTNEPKARTRPGEAAKAVVGKKIPRLERAVPVQVRPPAPDAQLGAGFGKSLRQDLGND